MLYGQQAVCVLGLGLGRRILLQYGDDLISPWRWLERLIPKGFLRSMQGEEHARYRRLMLRVFPTDPAPGDIEVVRGICRHHLAELASQGPAGDLRGALNGIATDVMIRVAYGVERPMADWHDLTELFDLLAPGGRQVWEPTAEQAAPFHTLCDVTRRLVRTGAAAGGLGQLLTEHGIDALDDTMVGNIVYGVDIGRYDLTGLLCWLLKMLSDAPKVAERVRGGAEPAPARAVVQETLRLQQAEGLHYIATADLEVEGYHIPKDTFLRVCLRESHRDPNVFPDPLRFDPDRFVDRRYDIESYAPFGLSRHRCIAADLVLTVGTVFVEELARGYRWRVVADGPEHRGTFHWEPSPKFAIELQPIH
ncbi:MAG: cytochrome P450 [Geminicoccaceae bacterium]